MAQAREELMTKEELLEALKALIPDSPTEEAHMEADALLLKYINDLEITAAYDALEKWYA